MSRRVVLPSVLIISLLIAAKEFSFFAGTIIPVKWPRRLRKVPLMVRH
jgi:hypothetical protein